MRDLSLTLPELALLVGTRAALGVGLGLLLADRLPQSQRKAVGWTLVLVGAVTTVPLAFEVLGEGPCLDPVLGRVGLFARSVTGVSAEWRPSSRI